MSKDDIIAQKEAEIAKVKSANAILEHENAQLKKLIFGFKSEKFKPTPIDANQLNMFADLEEPVATEQLTKTPVKGYTKTSKKKHPGRQALPDHLPLKEVIIEPEQDIEGLTKVGEEITEVLDYTPASLTRIRYIRPKYAGANNEGIIIAEMPERPLPKAIAEAGLLAHICVSKFVEHMPFYRQIQKFSREHQLNIPSSTINNWFAATCTLMEPLYNKLKEKVLDTEYLQADESPIKVQDSDKANKTHQGFMWVYHNPLQKSILFNYRKGRGQHGPKEILTNFKGILQCDGYSVYDKIAAKNQLTLAGCLVHVRRKYIEAQQSDATLANHALDLFSQVYKHEKIAKQSDDRTAYRTNHILPLLMELKKWVDEKSIAVLPKSPIGKAMRYTINQWDKIMNIFTDGRIELDNNLIENKIRPLALGRKNYLFAGSHKAAERIAMMYSFFATCKANNVNPQEWLKATLKRLPKTKMSQLDQLLPDQFGV